MGGACDSVLADLQPQHRPVRDLLRVLGDPDHRGLGRVQRAGDAARRSAGAVRIRGLRLELAPGDDGELDERVPPALLIRHAHRLPDPPRKARVEGRRRAARAKGGRDPAAARGAAEALAASSKAHGRRLRRTTGISRSVVTAYWPYPGASATIRDHARSRSGPWSD